MRIIEAHCHGYDDRNIEKVKKLGYEKVYLIDTRPEYLKEAVRKYPGFMLGFGWIPTDGNLQEDLDMVDRFKAAGCTGIKICGSVCRYDDDSMLPVYERISKYKMPIVYHTGWLWWDGFWSGKDYRMKKNARVDYYHPCTLDKIAFLFPDLKQVAYHTGNQWMGEAAYMIKNHSNIYGDTVMPPHRKEYLWDLLGGTDGGALLVLSKLLFGTDAANLEYGTCKDHIDRIKRLLDGLKLNKALQERIFYKNALTVAGMPDEVKKEARAERLKGSIEKAAEFSDFLDHDLVRFGEKARAKTSCRIAYDDKALHIRITCFDNNTKKLVLTSDGVPSGIWQDDCVEMFLSPGKDKKYFHLMVNPKGFASYDKNRGEIKEFKRAEHNINSKGWSLKLEVPFSLLNAAPKIGDVWGMNVFRDKKTAPKEISMWSEAISTFHDPDSFGKLIFK